MDNRCVFCNEIIPEGRMVCPSCEKKLSGELNMADITFYRIAGEGEDALYNLRIDGKEYIHLTLDEVMDRIEEVTDV